MARERNAYEILGLPRTAALSQIRTRYRLLVRRYQPARSTEQLFEDDKFVRMVQSFLLLSSPSRREYDRDLRAAKRESVPLPDLLGALSPAERVLLGAEAAFIRGELQDAVGLAKTVLQTSQHDARAWALLGEILMTQGKYDEAISSLNYAIQFDPNTRRHWNMLNEATALREGRAKPRLAVERPSVWERPKYAWAALAGAVVMVVFSLLWVRPRIHTVWYVYDLQIPVAALAVGALSGLALGVALAVANLLDRFDDELIGYRVWYEVAGGRDLTLVPVGLYIIPVGLIFFWLDVAFYAAIAYMDERFSISISLALAMTAALTVILMLLAPSGRLGIFLLAGNATFAGMILGWLLGSQRRAVWRKVDWPPARPGVRRAALYLAKQAPGVPALPAAGKTAIIPRPRGPTDEPGWTRHFPDGLVWDGESAPGGVTEVGT